MINHEVQELLHELTTCRTVNPDSEQQIITDIIVLTDDLCSRVAHRHCRYTGLDWAQDSDDLIELVLEVELQMLNSIAAGDPRALDCIPTWEAAVFVRGHSAIRSYADSPAVTGISGYTGVKRRQRALEQHRRAIQAALHEPLSTAELVEDWNATVASTRKDPKKQGAFATEADIANPVRVYPTDPGGLSGTALPMSTFDRSDAADIVHRVVSLCWAEGKQLGQVADCWLSWYPDGDPISPTEVAARIGISVYQVTRAIRQVREVFRTLFDVQ